MRRHYRAAPALTVERLQFIKKLLREYYRIAPARAVAHGNDAARVFCEEVNFPGNAFAPQQRLIRHHEHYPVRIADGFHAEAYSARGAILGPIVEHGYKAAQLGGGKYLRPSGHNRYRAKLIARQRIQRIFKHWPRRKLLYKLAFAKPARRARGHEYSGNFHLSLPCALRRM